MLKLTDEAREELSVAVEQAAGRADVRAAVEDLYARLQGEIDARKPKCDASGRCCRFEEYGHRLFVTAVELAAFVHRGDRQTEVGPPIRRADFSLPVLRSDGCPYQIDGLCSVHAIRPFGCRIFFCDPTSHDWQNTRYERFHGELKAMHERLGVPYFYVEWREALRALGLGGNGMLSRT